MYEIYVKNVVIKLAEMVRNFCWHRKFVPEGMFTASLEIYTHKPGPIEPRSEKTGLRGFRPGLTQTRLYNHSR